MISAASVCQMETAVIMGKTCQKKVAHYLQRRLLKRQVKEELELQISVAICWCFLKQYMLRKRGLV